MRCISDSTRTRRCFWDGPIADVASRLDQCAPRRRIRIAISASSRIESLPSAASLFRRLREAWHETELLRNGERVRHDGVFEDFAVTNGVDVDRHPLDVIARAGTSE
jgi:hypothetical protein